MNYYLDKNQIIRIASNSDVYNKGEQYYKNGFVEKLDFYNSETVYTVSARIRGSFSYYTTTLNFDNTGILKSHKCSCEAHGIWRGACQHVIAALLKVFHVNQQKAIISRDLRASGLMLDFFEKQAYKEIDAILNESSDPNNKISVIPTINMDDDNNLFLTFKIGRDKFYVLKNISEFINNLGAERIVSYGKSLEFKHKISMFDSRSASLINVILRENEENSLVWNKKLSRLFYYNNALIGRVVFLSPRTMDRLFRIYENTAIALKIPSFTESTVMLVKKRPPVKFDIKPLQNDHGLELVSHTTEIVGIRGEESSYILSGDFLYQTDNSYFDTIHPIIDAFSKTAENKITINKKEIGRFMTFLYPRLKENGFVDKDINFSSFDIEFDPLIKKMYFDVFEKGVSCKVLFCYGETKINPLDEDGFANRGLSDTSRNKLEEYKLVQRLNILGFTADKRIGCYVLKDENLLYDFYYSPMGLETLQTQNETYATDEFLNKSVKPKLTTSFGVRLAGNLLEISLDRHEYNADELLEIINSYNLKKRYHRLKNGAFLSLEGENNNLESTVKLISGLGLTDRDVKKGVINVPQYRALYLSRLAKENAGLSVKLDDSVDTVADDFNAYKDLKFEIPSQLEDVLRHYQKEGFKWLNVISYYGFGGILADDMGLGKTLQVISILLSFKGKLDKPSIVVAPTSLIYNWENEINKFAPELKSVPIAGLPSRRCELLGGGKNADVYITTYDVLKKDIDNYDNIEFEYIIADEAQNIKNPGTQNARALKRLKGRVRYALTGTPIENSLSELWSIFDFIMPGYLFNHSKFSKQYEIPIIKNDDQQKSEELRKQISPFILRRLKSDVLKELPEKIETTLYADMTVEQKKIYAAHLFKAKGELEENVKEGTFSKHRIDILAQLTRLRQICCHPSVFINDYKGGSGKLDLTMETIKSSLEAGHRVLLFSQFTSMLAIIQEKLQKESIEYFYLDGFTDSKKRTVMADRFNNGYGKVFLISLKAGGTGLNITGADVVIHFDPWWNPAVMDQASDRAHRFGQKRTVQVINIVAKDSIEEKILQLQEKKKNLVDNVIQEGAGYLSAMSQEEILSLFKE